MACHNTFKNKFSCELYQCRNAYNKLRVEGVTVDEELMKDIVLTWSSQSRMDDNFLILKDLE